MCLLLCSISILSFGQIDIEKSRNLDSISQRVVSASNPGDQHGYSSIIHYFDNDFYILRIRSTNQFEDKTVDIPLGKGKEQAMESLLAIEDLYKNAKDKDLFVVKDVEDNDIKGVVNKSKLMIYGSLSFFLPNAAGSYILYKWNSTDPNTLDIIHYAKKAYKKNKF